MAAFICIVVILHLSSAASIIRKPGGDECNGVVCGEDLICANKLNSSSKLVKILPINKKVFQTKFDGSPIISYILLTIKSNRSCEFVLHIDDPSFTVE